MQVRPWKAAILLFFSGACALIYQTVWMRDFRLIFGASTLATGAVLAIFMGGLGLGSALLGRRADRHPHPLALYGQLEMLIAASAALTPLLLIGVRWAYLAAGGSATLGSVMATVIRLVLSALVLLIPTMLMGGTLPAASRAVESNDDGGRRRLALLYGINTLGAVFGAVIATFVMLERFGNRATLLIAAAVNLGVGALAWWLGRQAKKQETEAAEEPFREAAMPAKLILIAAALVGFAFLLMELVWYRMLSPLLGGTTFMFGLILAIALAGIGIGGAIYSFGKRERTASAAGFAVTCTFEALAMIVPFVLGDRLAVLANSLRTLRIFGFSGYVVAWTTVTAIVALPAAIIAGYQFPLLISLLGRGRDSVGREVGLAYAWNTGGAIAASLLGGFLLIPQLGATGSWKLATGILVALGAVTLLFGLREKKKLFTFVAAAAAVASIAFLFALGPTAAWRHSGIGAGRAPQLTTRNALYDWLHATRHGVLFEADGAESSIGLLARDDLGLIVNGKSDGSARADAGTQVMSGMIGALIHPAPKKSFVIGLGTGTTSGWLAAIPDMERVDVVELEPVIVDIATYYAPVNRDAMNNPKHVTRVGDAREVLLTTRETYDLIFSEPSNPYRAGIASLYTREFYSAAATRLRPGGLFLQWMQMYSVDSSTLQTIYATLSSVFPNVNTWTTTSGDIILVASREQIVVDADLIRRRLAVEPYRSATHAAWRVESVEGVLSHFVASERLATAAAQQATAINTDDKQIVEFSFARLLGSEQGLEQEIVASARRLQADRPLNVRGAVDWNAVGEHRSSLEWLRTGDAKNQFAEKYALNDYLGALAIFRTSPWKPVNSLDMAAVAHVLANAGDETATQYIDMLRPLQATEADALTGILRHRQRRSAEAAASLRNALIAYRQDPWPLLKVMDSAVAAASEIAADPALADVMLDALSQPFSAHLLEEQRDRAYLAAAWQARKCSVATITALQEFEPNVPWRASVLQIRSACYAAANLGALSEKANRDLREFSAAESSRLVP
ncbi:MAG TPA: fused MFS/spermidine synthase [Thermoanaerobaculia bacterium]|nr:fused MFS/spermidine synthase [Thermoanaerobaculia bacterium]